MVDLTVNIGSLALKSPVMVASGTFGYGQESKDLLNLSELGGVVTKSVSLNPKDGNPPPRIYELPAGMLNSIGLANVGLDSFISEKLPFLRNMDTALIVNIAGSSTNEFQQVIGRLENESDIHAYELNFSCPNVKEGGLAFSQDAAVTADTVRRLRSLTSRPLIVKLTPNVTRIHEIAQAAADEGADAVSLINTLLGLAIDIETQKPRIFTGAAGYSGPAIKPVALAKVYEVAQNVDIPIIGIGGISNGADALEFMITGACAVQIGTANFIDPGTGPRAVSEIRDYCERHKVSKVSLIVGTLQSWE